jgi:peptidoglycan/LPS O-acetylase OafA/YrhL
MTSAKKDFRPDIEGLRALAVLGVIFFHLGVRQLPGGFLGVDVFFVISGFLITRMLIAEYDKTGGVDFSQFWARRFRRLAPAAILVVVSTLIYIALTHKLFAVRRAIDDATFALTYLTNWYELWQQLDYFSAHNRRAFFTHYWSLGVEEQFYLLVTLFGVLLIAAARVARSRGKQLSYSGLGLFLFVVAVVSLFSGILSSNDNHALGFFGAHARVWQFCAGALCAIFPSLQKEQSWWKDTIKFAGLLTIVGAFVFVSSRHWPPEAGRFAVAVGATMVIATPSSPRLGWNASSVLLDNPVSQFVGRISYSLYLWHWPVTLVIAPLIKGRASVLECVAVISVTMILAALTFQLVENPLRYNSWLAGRRWRTHAAAAAAVVAAIAITQGYNVLHLSKQDVIVLANGKRYDVSAVKKDRPRIYFNSPRCHLDFRDVVPPDCKFGDPKGSRVMVLFGDSHAAQWFPALDKIAAENGFLLISRTKSACGPTHMPILNSALGRRYTECEVWRKSVIEEIRRIKPDLLVLASSSSYVPAALAKRNRLSAKITPILERRALETFALLKGLVRQLVVIQDTPSFADDPKECLPQNPKPEECATPAARALKNRFPWAGADELSSAGISTVSMNDMLCNVDHCGPIVSGELAFIDTNHLSASYVRSMSEALLARLKVAGVFK